MKLFSKLRSKNIWKTWFVRLGAIFLLGIVLGGAVVHLWDQEELWLNRRAVGTIVLTSKNLFDIDSKMLNADSEAYKILASCVTKPDQCNAKQSYDNLAEANKTYNSLIKPRENAFVQLKTFYKQFQALSPI